MIDRKQADEVFSAIEARAFALARVVAAGTARPRAMVAARPWFSAVTAAAAACALCMLLIDEPLAWFFKDLEATSPEFFTFFHAITHLGDATVYLVVLVLLAAVFRFLPRRPAFSHLKERFARYGDACLFVLLSVIVSGIAINVVKPLLGRVRPEALFENGFHGFMPFNWDFPLNSFPSGHSQTIWSLAVAMLLVHRRYDAFYILVAVLVAFSRVVVHAHYLSDVIGGAFIGAVTAILLKKFFFDAGGRPVELVFERDRRWLAPGD